MSGLNLMDMIMGAAGGQAPQQIGSQFGLDPAQSQSAVAALLPAISSGLKKNSATPQGLASLLGAVQDGHHGQYLDNPTALSQESAVTEGNGVLGHIFGSKEVSRAVAGRAAEQSGISPTILKQMLPMVAMMAMGSVSKQAAQQTSSLGSIGQLAMQQLMGGGGATRGGLGGMLGGLLGGGARRQQKQQAQAHNQGLGMLGNMLDADGDGSSMDDILGMLMKR